MGYLIEKNVCFPPCFCTPPHLRLITIEACEFDADAHFILIGASFCFAFAFPRALQVSWPPRNHDHALFSSHGTVSVTTPQM